MFFNGSKNTDGVGAVVILISPKGEKLCYTLRLNFMPCTNNVVEYEALLHGM
jgi:ribonuclease HI